MSYLSTPGESPLYEAERPALGYVPNYLRVLALRPEVYHAWLRLGEAVRAGMDPRRYELVTLTAARRLGSTYCGLAHAAALLERFYDDVALRAIMADHHDAGLPPVDVAAMDFADRVAADPAGVTGGTSRSCAGTAWPMPTSSRSSSPSVCAGSSAASCPRSAPSPIRSSASCPQVSVRPSGQPMRPFHASGATQVARSSIRSGCPDDLHQPSPAPSGQVRRRCGGPLPAP